MKNTAAAHERKIELVLGVRHASLAARLASYFEALAPNGQLIEVSLKT